MTFALGHAEEGARLLGAAQGVRASHALASDADDDESERHLRDWLGSALGDQPAAEAITRGRALTLDEAVGLARDALLSPTTPMFGSVTSTNR